MIGSEKETEQIACSKDYPRIAPKIAVLVRVRNEFRALPEFWRMLSDQNIASQCEYIFLDCGSTDGSLEYLLTLPASVYRIAPEHFSFGRSCNQLIERSTAPVICFLSAHVFLEQKDALDSAIVALSQGQFSAAYLRQVPNSILGASVYEKAQLARRYPAKTRCTKVRCPGGFSNAASIFTRDSWLRNPFPDIHGSEDFRWVQRHLQLGGTLLYLAATTARHSHNESPEELFIRVSLNVRARGTRRSVARSGTYFIGVFISLLRVGGSLGEAWHYAVAHASAYFPRGDGAPNAEQAASIVRIR